MPDLKEIDQFLKFKVLQGFKKRKLPMSDEYLARIDYEMGIISQMDYSTYFLIVADLCRFMRESGIFFIVRGSGCGSCVVWGLGISHRWLDPIKYGLPFERFLNPQRISLPDLDIDIQDDRRSEVVEYTIKKYGADRVAKIVTFGTMGAKQSIHDLARGMDIPDYQTVASKIANAIPAGKGDDGKNIRIIDQLKVNELLREQQRLYPDLIDVAMKVEGRVRHASVHAAGTIIAPDKMTKFLPLYFTGDPASREAEDNFPVTQWDMYDAESCGLLKMDYLGLKTLRVIAQTVRAVRAVQAYNGIKEENLLDIDYIPQDDDKTWKMLSEGKTSCIFQVEKGFVQDFARRSNLLIKNPWALAVLIAIIRPGMMDTGNTERFLKRASGLEEPQPPHPLLAETFRVTYGIMCFQEDVMWCARDFAGFSMGEADVLRKGVGKKNPSFIKKQQPIFFDGGQQPRVRVTFPTEFMFDGQPTKVMVTKPRHPDLVKAVDKCGWKIVVDDSVNARLVAKEGATPINGVTLEFVMAGANKEDCERIWHDIEAHSRYSFNNAHAAAYGVVVLYWTAWLKANHPLIFMTCMINSESGSSSKEDGYNYKVAEYVTEARSMGIRVVQPCVVKSRNACNADLEENVIRFGLSLVKKVSNNGVQWIVNHCRESVSFKDFVLKCFETVADEAGIPKVYARVTRTDLEQLIWAGAFDVFDPDRCKLVHMLPTVLKLADSFHEQTAKVARGKRVQKKPEDVYNTLMQYAVEDDEVENRLSLEQILEKEREVTGCFLSQTPFDPYMNVIRQHCNCTPAELVEGYDIPQQPCFAGMLTKLSTTTVKNGSSKGQEMAFVGFTGLTGDIEMPVFAKDWAKIKAQNGKVEKGKIYVVYVRPDNRSNGYILTAIRRLSGCYGEG